MYSLTILNPLMIYLFKLYFLIYIRTERSSEDNIIETIKIDDDKLLNKLKRLTEKHWDDLDIDDKKELAYVIKSEYEPLGKLFDQQFEINIQYYRKINDFVINQIEILNNKLLEVFYYIDEAIKFLYQEDTTSVDMSKVDFEGKKFFIDTITLNDLKNDDFYFHLLKEDIQLHHLNLFLFIRQNITSDINEGCDFMIELLNRGNKKQILKREHKKSIERINFTELLNHWNSLFENSKAIHLTFQEKKNKEEVDRIEKKIYKVLKEEKDLEFILFFFENSKLLKLVINYILHTKKRCYFDDVCLKFSPNVDYKKALVTNKKFREFISFLIKRKNEWTQYRFFYIFDDQKYINKIITRYFLSQFNKILTKLVSKFLI